MVKAAVKFDAICSLPAASATPSLNANSAATVQEASALPWELVMVTCSRLLVLLVQCATTVEFVLAELAFALEDLEDQPAMKRQIALAILY